MTQRGGSAAINGFLYQILRHLDWLTEVSLSGTLEGNVIKDGRLILEPKNGGDAQARAPDRLLVEQYKTRSNDTWSLAAVVDVLRDLRKAVPDPPPKHACYRFVTDGRPGKLEAFYNFLDRLNRIQGPDDLDNETKHSFKSTFCVTDQGFLDHVAAKTRHVDDDSPEAEERELVLHLLRCFEMKFEVDSKKTIGTVEARLRPLVDNLGDEAGVRERLIGILMERLGSGEAKLDKGDVDVMFREVGLMPDRLRKVGKLARTLEELMHRGSRHLKYDRKYDVRGVPYWPDTKPVLLIAGENGAGKSWQLARLMQEGVKRGEPVVFVRGDGTAEDILTRAADQIWQVALGETSAKTLQAVSNILREKDFELHHPYYTIAVDDVGSIDVARGLVHKDWTSLGARLVLTLPRGLASALNSSDGEVVQLHPVGEFSIEELTTLLGLYDHRWTELPTDLRRLLRKPVLAGLFLALDVRSFQDAPQSEYEIFQAFWSRMEIKCDAVDTGIVVALAARVLQGKSYPLPQEHWAEIGLNKDSLVALELAGWLSCLEHGGAAFAHDRLLNWAVAQHLCRQFMCKTMSVDELFDYMASAMEPQWCHRLGYVAMDTLWLLSADEASKTAVSHLVERMERHRMFGETMRHLYTQLLPTLGQRAVPILLQRLQEITVSSAGDGRIGLIGDALTTLARQKSVDIRAQLGSLLQAPLWGMQSAAVRVLVEAPDVQRMDRLWTIHQQRRDDSERNPDAHARRAYELTFTALRKGVALKPKWLWDRIREADPGKERVADLASLLSSLEDPMAKDIWKDVRGPLMEKVPTDNPQSLLNCIARFGDQECKDFVLRHLPCSENWVSTAALLALAVLDPEEVIERLADADGGQLLLREEWLPLLLSTHSELTLDRIRALAVSDLRWQNLLEVHFEKRPADLDEQTLDLMLRGWEAQLRERSNEITASDVPWFPLRVLGRMCSPGVLRRLQDEAGGDLEAMVVKSVSGRLREDNDELDPTLAVARRVLVLFAGGGISDLINLELESEHFWVRRGGLDWAWVCGNEDATERLITIARRPIARDSSGKAEPKAVADFYSATTGLAALGADEVLVEVLSNPEWVSLEPSRTDQADPTVVQAGLLARFRAHRGPMPKKLTDGAVSAMRNFETSEDALLCSLVIAWLSGDTELIPDVRNVLGRAESESLIASYACLALEALGDSTAEFSRIAEGLAFTKKNCSRGLSALIKLDDEGVDGLKLWLKLKGDTEAVVHIAHVIQALYANEGSRGDAVKAAVEFCRTRSMSSYPLYVIAAESSDPSVREKIFDDAFSKKSFDVDAPIYAMRGLAKYDTDSAAEAIEMGLSKYPELERQLCQLLVEVKQEAAVEKLLEAAVDSERDSLSDAVGRALRRLDSNVVAGAITSHLQGMETERKIVCRIAGWLPVPEVAKALEQATRQESVISVRRSALDALYRHRKEKAIQRIYSEFRTERCAARRWAFLVAVVRTADPYLLTDEKDPLWLGRILTKDVPYAFCHYADEALKRKKEKQRAQVMRRLREGRA